MPEGGLARPMASEWVFWGLWAPPVLAFLGALAPSLLAARKVSIGTARILSGAALVAVLALLLVAYFTARGVGAALDLALAGVLVALAALGVRRPFAWALVLVAALAAAKGLGQLVMAIAVPIFLGPGLAGALLWVATALLALSLAIIRLKAPPRSTPGGTTRAGSRRS